MTVLKTKQKLGKYRIERRLGGGGFADVYRALDTVEGVRVALKIPKSRLSKEELEDFRKEARLAARLDHPNILPIKNAGHIGTRFVIAYPCGEGTLEQRMERRLTIRDALRYGEQLVAALAHAHEHGIIHRDVKPENLLLFPGERLRLADFGVAKLATKTVSASSAGTLGYMAPEQALGRPSPRSDVFTAGLILWEMLTGELPEWPYEWPPPGYEKLRGRVHPDLIAFLKRTLEVSERKRFTDATQMLAAFRRLKPQMLRYLTGKRGKARRAQKGSRNDWRQVRFAAFKKEHGAELETRAACRRCGGPLAESMRHCPWCGNSPKRYAGPHRFPRVCGRCHRSLKSDWRYCAHCYGPGYKADESRFYEDRRYDGKCAACREPLMPHMQYCPWCRTKVRKKWKAPGSDKKCPRCGWGVYPDYWRTCPWCGKGLRK